ncbi:MAG: hypothetical protein IPJ30_25590 [Acidobacteria bacterium]|nr:hypothetical protein [Acidobacteriota bacterium]
MKSTDGGAPGLNWLRPITRTSDFARKSLSTAPVLFFVATSRFALLRPMEAQLTVVLGTGLLITGATSNFSYDVEIAANGDVYGSLDGSIHKSTTAGATFSAAQTLPITASRIELACAPNDANFVYALVELGTTVNGILRTTNGGTTWTSRTEPADADPGVPAADFSNGQGWYDLAIAVDPNNRDILFVGGIDLFKSSDHTLIRTQIAHWYGGFGLHVHADQRQHRFPKRQFDGRVFRERRRGLSDDERECCNTDDRRPKPELPDRHSSILPRCIPRPKRPTILPKCSG